MTLSTRQIRLIAAFVGANLLLVLVGWFAVVSPQRDAAAAAAAQAQQAQTELDVLNGQVSGGPTKQPTIHTAGIYALDTALPSQADQPNLLLELDRVAKVSGVKILGISPQPATATLGGYTVVPMSLSVEGSYFEVTGFLRNLRMLVSEHDGRLIANGPLFAATSLSFISGQEEGDAPAQVGLQVFYYGTTAGAAAPASTTTPTTGS